MKFPVELVSNHSGEHLMVRVKLAELWNQSSEVISQCNFVPTRDDADAMHPELFAIADSFPANVMFLDLETCGFAGSMVFLVGVLVCVLWVFTSLLQAAGIRKVWLRSRNPGFFACCRVSDGSASQSDSCHPEN